MRHKLIFAITVKFIFIMKLPPLHALVCFEHAARRLSMKAAAEALHVSPAAVSQQVAKLEEAVGTPLFERQPRRLQLTEAGRRYLDAIQPALRQIAQATQALQSDASSDVVHLSCTTGFDTQWLLPRLPRFQARAPQVEVRINTTHRLVDLQAEGFDFAVRHGPGPHPGLKAEKLLDDPLVPVCSPRLLGSAGPASIDRDLPRMTLLHDEHRGDWTLWLNAVGASHVDALRGPVFVDCNGVVQAAVAGLGIALVRPTLVRQELADGRLVMPFDASVGVPFGYHLVQGGRSGLRQGPARFKRWLMAEAQAAREAAAA